MRNRKNTILAFTLTEMLVTMAIMVIVMAAAVPTVQKLREAMEQSTGVKSIIDAAMANARAIAIREQKYAGVRFQMDKTREKQYLIFVIYDPTLPPGVAGNLGCKAVAGKQPMALPENQRVMDYKIQKDYTDFDAEDYDLKAVWQNYLDSKPVPLTPDKFLNTDQKVNDTLTFTILFSPQGSLVIHTLRVVSDSTFNAANANAKFIEDGYSADGLSILENSRNSFIVFDKRELAKIAPEKRWSDYFSNLNSEYISPYTGELIRKE